MRGFLTKMGLELAELDLGEAICTLVLFAASEIDRFDVAGVLEMVCRNRN